LILKNEKVPFAKLKLIGLAKLLVAEHATNQNPITTWIRILEALNLNFYPSSYKIGYEFQVALPTKRIQHACARVHPLVQLVVNSSQHLLI
jgi:hypothetical protein